jgi:hypothetical protein
MRALDPDDRWGIQDLLSRYCHYFDSGEGDAWADLFTADGVCEVPSLRLAGREELRALPAMSAERSEGKFRHQITNILTEPTGEGATFKAYGLMTDWREGGALMMLATYTGSLTKGPGGWRIVTLKAAPA